MMYTIYFYESFKNKGMDCLYLSDLTEDEKNQIISDFNGNKSIVYTNRYGHTSYINTDKIIRIELAQYPYREKYYKAKDEMYK